MDWRISWATGFWAMFCWSLVCKYSLNRDYPVWNFVIINIFPCFLTNLCKIQQVRIISETLWNLLSSLLRRILNLPLRIAKARSTVDRAEESVLLKRLWERLSIALIGQGFNNQGRRGYAPSPSKSGHRLTPFIVTKGSVRTENIAILVVSENITLP